MKKLLLASAIAALSVSAAQAAPTVYGKAFLTLDLNSGDTDTTTTNTTTNTSVKTSTSDDGRSQLNSNSSRIGLKGSEALTANTDLVYQLEYGIDVDAGDEYVDQQGKRTKNKSDQFYARDTYVGLANAQYGTVLAGRLSAIDGEVDYANVASGGVLGGDGVLASIDAPRANNSFAYISPKYNDLQFMAMYVMDENDKADTFNRDVFGIGAKYEMGAMNAGVSYLGGGDDFKALRVSGNYAVSPAVTVGALYQMSDFDTDDNENAFTISGEMATATPWTAYAQGDMVSNVEGASDADAFRVLVGGKYAFNKATTGHLYGAYLNKENTTVENTIKTKTDFDGFGIGGGVEYKF
ncbi:porin [Psychrobacter pygoscelis]|uniref:porin n=1 Tax=Psychrobacter pygoscelis TaxID=2488563 RepID=UPI00103D0A18|nr:porin [Psychrobacter pygoscelis]